MLLAQPGTIEVTGARFYSADRVRSLVSGHAPDSSALIVQRAYAADGFLAASVERSPERGIVINEGARYVIGRVQVRTDSAVLAQLPPRAGYTELEGEYFTTETTTHAIAELLAALDRAGYPLARARVDDLEVNDSAARVDLVIGLVPGDRPRINLVEVRGNTGTKRGLIVAAAAVPPDALFTEELASQVRARLVRLNLFSDVAEPQLFRADSGRYGLLLSVTEGNANTFDGVIGYQPGDAGRDGTFTGLVNIAFRNILGTGRRASLRWQKQTATASLLELRYGEPLLFGLPLDMEIGFQQTQEETTSLLLSYVKRSFVGDLYYGLTDAFTVRLGGAYEGTIPQVDTTQPCARQLLNASVLETTVGIGYDSRSSTVNPISGVRYATSYAVGAKSINGPAPCDVDLPRSDVRRRIELDLDAYVPVLNSFVVAAGLHYGEVRADLLEESDLFRFGGQSTVRGYLENTFRASRRAWGNLEIRLLLSTTSYAAAFLDGGYYERAADPRRSLPFVSDRIPGYGVAAQLETALGIVRLSYALGRDDTFATGKVFVGLANQF